MPQATDDSRNMMVVYFGKDAYCDLYAPLQFLKENGWTDREGWLFSPNREITLKEWDCVDFLCDEWDFSFDASKSAATQ